MRARQLGSLIGASGGLAFVLANAGSIPGATAWRSVGIALFVVAVVGAIAVRGPAAQPTQQAIRIYWTCVAAEVVAIPLGAWLLRTIGQPDLTLPWVVLVLGVHFVPFARAFAAPIFGALGWSLIVLAVVGGIAAAAYGEEAGRATGVLAGFALLGFSLAGTAATRRADRRQHS